MILDIIKAILIAGVPVALVSYYFTVLTSKKINLKAKNAKELKTELKQLTLKKGNEENAIQHMVHKKWMKFGGGFYGVMAFITYVHIEVYQLIDFVRNFTSFQDFLDSIGLMMIINFFIEAIMNLVTAFLWFFYWYKYLPIGSFWVWLIVVFLANASATIYALIRKK